MCVRCTVSVCAVAVLLCPGLCSDPPHRVRESQHTEDLYVAVGSAVNVPCEGVEGAEGVEGVEGAHWRLNGTPLTPGPVLSIPGTRLEDRGNYSCHGGNGSLLRTLSLQPGYPPSRPKVKCSSPGYPLTATCTWSEEPEPTLPTRYSATYGIVSCYEAGLCVGRASNFQPCLPGPSPEHQCVLSVLLFHQEPHVVNVTAANPLGSNFTLFSFIVEDVVKPDPPVHVRVVPKPGRQLYVEWAPPPSWTDPTNFPLKYWVEYHPGNGGKPRKLGPYESQSMFLKALRTGTAYTVRVSGQDQLVGRRSDWSEAVSATVLSR